MKKIFYSFLFIFFSIQTSYSQPAGPRPPFPPGRSAQQQPVELTKQVSSNAGSPEAAIFISPLP